MTALDLYKSAKQLEQKIARANSAQRLALHPELTRVLERMKVRGQTVPAGLRDLNTTLHQEAVESWFDNMPV